MRSILITGANSYIGVSFENYIKANYPDCYTVDTVDMIDGAWRDKSFSGYDVVFHVAGIAHQKETKENASLYYEVNCDLAKETAEKAKNEGVRQFILLSSMSVYGVDGGVITQNTAPNPKSNYGKSKLMAENAVIPLGDESFCVTVIRPPMVYGAGCRGNFNSLVSFANKLPVFPSIKNQRSMIYIDNLTEFVKSAIDGRLCGVYMPQNKEYMSTCDIAEWILETQGKKMRKSRLLGVGIKMLMPFVSSAKKAFGSLTYHHGLEALNFGYCVTDAKESVKKSVVSEDKNGER